MLNYKIVSIYIGSCKCHMLVQFSIRAPEPPITRSFKVLQLQKKIAIVLQCYLKRDGTVASLYKFLLYIILSFLFLFITLLDYIILLGSIYYFNELNRKIKVRMLGVL